MARKIDIESAPLRVGSRYPKPYDEACAARERRQLGDAAGLTQFGVNLLRLPPGVWSSQRHWHKAEDEFVYILQGEVVMVSDEGEAVLRAGDCAGFPKDSGDGHCLQNRSGADALLLEIGTRQAPGEVVDYPDIDMILRAGAGYAHKDGRPYEPDDFR
ncbi:MAG: cupin domain-containing protein [Caulobacteraceae bacterium]